MSFSYCAFLVVVVMLAGAVVAMPDGAPSAACKTMTPQHGRDPQSSLSPYTTKPSKVRLTVHFHFFDGVITCVFCNKVEILSNGSLEVTLQAESGQIFRGIACEMCVTRVCVSTCAFSFHVRLFGDGLR